MAEEIKFASSVLAEYVTDANEVLEFKLVLLPNLSYKYIFVRFRYASLKIWETKA